MLRYLLSICCIHKEKAKPINNIKKERQPIPRDIRNKVWIKYHGEQNIGICYSCGKTIDRYNKGWHCSHVVADAKNGPTEINNLRTCCPRCNLSMGDQNLYVYVRDKGLQGPAAANVKGYLQRHESQLNDRRTNNWRKNKI